MGLSGSLRTMAIEDLVDWADRRFVCGTLTVERGEVERSFHFDSGYVTHAASSVPGERLGQMLLYRNLVSEEQLKEAFDTQAQTGVMLGKVLIMVGAVGEDDLRATLEVKIRDSLSELLCWEDGTFRYEPAPARARSSEFPISVNLRTAFEAGLTQVEERRKLRELIPSDSERFFLLDGSSAAREGDSDERRHELERIVERVSRGLTVNHMVLEQHGDRIGVLETLAELLRRGAIARERRSEARSESATADAPGLERAARGRAAGGDRVGALELAQQALAADPDSASAQKLHRELERKVLSELSRDLLARFRVPRLLKSKEELAALELSDAERYLAGRIDGRWDLLSLMRVSPLREVEALLTFKRLADRGIISL